MDSPPSLTYADRQFLLAGTPYHVFSGAVHYFRVVPEYWRDRLTKVKVCGLNTVETYVPWNLHEPQPGVFNTEGILDIRKFLQVASDLDLKVILRPGPYICSEWDFGGLPSWLLSDPTMEVRSNHEGYKRAADRYLSWILGLVKDLQFCHGGPIIAVQVENEFGSYSDDVTHLHFIRDVIKRSGIQELLMTSDNPWGFNPGLNLPGVLPTANFQTVAEGTRIVSAIERCDTSFPLLAMEFWTGWFDHWGSSEHHTRHPDILENSLRFLLDKKAGGVNFYMFHGGTNFGFMAGANQTGDVYKPDVTSYDYDAPLTENGAPTEKYFKIREMIREFRASQNENQNGGGMPVTPDIIDPEVLEARTIREPVEIVLDEVMTWSDMTGHVTKVTSRSCPVTMEMLKFPQNQIQSYGYVVYRNYVTTGNVNVTGTGSPGQLLVLPAYVKDRATVLLDGEHVAVLECNNDNDIQDGESRPPVVLPPHVVTQQTTTQSRESSSRRVLDIVVENLGRVNYTEKDKPHVLNQQRKGMEGEVTLDGNPLGDDWTIIALDFTQDFITAVSKNSDAWKKLEEEGNGSPGTGTNTDPNPTGKIGTPALYRSDFSISGQPSDCFVTLDGFTKGIVIVNGLNLGRYWSIGPQKSLYLPAPVLHQGHNTILVFEEQKAARSIFLSPQPRLS